mgnify:CR=1 FL=1
MKNLINLIMLMVAGFIVTSCTIEQVVDSSATRATLSIEVVTNGAIEDDYLHKVRFITFDKASFSPHVDVNQVVLFDDYEKNATSFRTELEVSSNRDKMLVAIINEPDALTSQLNNVQTLVDLEDIDFQMADVFNANHTAPKSTGIPMTGTARGISVAPENTASNPAQVSLTVYRSVARVELWLKADPGVAAYVDDLTEVTLSKSYNKGFLMKPEPDYNFGQLQTVTPNTTVEWTFTGTVSQSLNEDAQLVCSFYTPERTYMASDNSDKLVLDIKGVSSDQERRSTQAVLSEFSTGGGSSQTITRIERNNVYRIIGRLKTSFVEFEHNILPWKDMAEAVIIDPQYYLRISKDQINLPDKISESVSITAETNYNRNDRGYEPGIVIGKTYYYDSTDNKQESGNLFGWLETQKAGSLISDIKFKATKDLVTTPRGCYAKVEIKAGNAVKMVKINR